MDPFCVNLDPAWVAHPLLMWRLLRAAPDGHSPRVTSIAVRHIGSGRLDHSQIGQVAGEKAAALREVDGETCLDELGEEILSQFYEFVRVYTQDHIGFVDICET